MAAEHLVQLFAVAHVDLIKRHVLVRDLLHAAACLGAGVHEVVDDHDLHALLQQLHAGVAADIAHAAGYQYCHLLFLPKCPKNLGLF